MNEEISLAQWQLSGITRFTQVYDSSSLLANFNKYLSIRNFHIWLIVNLSFSTFSSNIEGIM